MKKMLSTQWVGKGGATHAITWSEIKIYKAEDVKKIELGDYSKLGITPEQVSKSGISQINTKSPIKIYTTTIDLNLNDKMVPPSGPRNKWSVNEHLKETVKTQSNDESVTPIKIIDMLSYGYNVNSKIKEIQKKR
jgi:hypothetical protein